MTEKNRFSKPVAFNHKNEKDQKILDHVKRRNFSGYVKKLILADMQKNIPYVEPNPNPVKEEVVPQTIAEKLEELRKKASNKPAN